MTGRTRSDTSAPALRAIVDELVAAGISDVVICPGSRSTPMALALRSHPSVRVWMHLDERAGAFFALGLAKGSRRCTAILATSGTAVVNFMPAVVEARHAKVPLILLTADRPPELRDRGAPQAIDQDHLYGRFSKWYAEVAVSDAAATMESHIRSVIARAVATAGAAPAGPVQLNLPFREPLIPDGPLEPGAATETSAATEASAPMVISGTRHVGDGEMAAIALRVTQASRGLIVCGPLDIVGFPDAVAALAAATGFPILADALSNVRAGPHDRSAVIPMHNALLRSAGFVAAHVPDLVVRFGGTPTSKVLVETLQGWAAPQIVVDDGGWNETTLLPTTMVQAEPIAFSTALTASIDALAADRAEAWSASWHRADAVAKDARLRWLAALEEPFEGAIFNLLAEVLPDGTMLFAGNGMPVWDMDAFLGGTDSDIRCQGNRGANGIDGLVSTALGMAASHAQPTVAVVGDISFIHDLNALVAARQHRLSATIVLVNNDGGGIFSFLPQATADRPEVGLPQHYEELFGTPHGLEFAPLVRALGADHQLVDHRSLREAVGASIASPGVQVLELRTERARNVELHRQATAVVAEAVNARALAAPERP